MAAPATTGQLRTRLQDMAVGDYIVCNYTAASGAYGSFSNFGGEVGTEIPLAGAAVPNGSFYFVKVADGLLVADRVVQHSISWSALNSGRAMQGIRLPLASRFTEPKYGGEPLPSIADGSIATQHYVSTLDTVSYEFNYTGVLRGIHVYPSSGLASGVPYQFIKDYEIYGSVNDSWVLIKAGRLPDFVNSWHDVEFDQDYNFGSYRFNVLSTYWTALPFVYKGVAEITPFGGVVKVRSLTGGIAFKSSDGSPVSSDGGFGTFPQNEWDTYVLGFDKVAPGKTLEDVFHGSACATLVQDTPLQSWSASTNRVYRGGQDGIGSLFYGTATSSSTGRGFRPVIEYKQ